MHDPVIPSQSFNLNLAVHSRFPAMQLYALSREYLRKNRGSLSTMQGLIFVVTAMFGFTLSYQILDRAVANIQAKQNYSLTSQPVTYEPPNWGHPAQTAGSATR